MVIDFHTHTYHSYDCRMQPLKILEQAKKKGLSAIVINDHDTIKGGLECASVNPYTDLLVIVGAEIKTDIGDVTGIFLKEEIRARKHADVVAEIKKQGGISILNHPFVGHKLNETNLEIFDLIEGYNGRLTKEQNQQGIELAKKLNKPIIAGSDSHTYSEIGNCKTFYNEPVNWMLPAKTEYIRSSVMAPLQSQFTKAIKKKDFNLLMSVILGAPRKIIRRLNES